MRTAFDAWRSYERDVVPADAGVVQREECRRAFCAGAWAAFNLVLEATDDPDDEQCERNLQALRTELQCARKDLRILREGLKA